MYCHNLYCTCIFLFYYVARRSKRQKKKSKGLQEKEKADSKALCDASSKKNVLQFQDCMVPSATSSSSSTPTQKGVQVQQVGVQGESTHLLRNSTRYPYLNPQSCFASANTLAPISSPAQNVSSPTFNRHFHPSLPLPSLIYGGATSAVPNRYLYPQSNTPIAALREAPEMEFIKVIAFDFFPGHLALKFGERILYCCGDKRFYLVECEQHFHGAFSHNSVLVPLPIRPRPIDYLAR